jgi:hypothetical protein
MTKETLLGFELIAISGFELCNKQDFESNTKALRIIVHPCVSLKGSIVRIIETNVGDLEGHESMSVYSRIDC